jgi:hypothetical protein
VGRPFSPLDKKLKLRSDHWSDGAARVAVRQGLQSKSFDLAAAAYQDAVGGGMSSDSLSRLTIGWGQAVEAKRNAEKEKVFAPSEVGERYDKPWIEAVSPVAGQGNLSTDGGMILLRTEGWKEVKMTAISEVCLLPTSESDLKTRKGACVQEPRVKLRHHSYQAGLWNAEEMGQHQYLEGLRRDVAGVGRLSSVNDGAVWIERITTTNFPRAVQIVDWAHAKERLWNVSKAVFGETSPPAKQWAETYVDRLWHGRVEEVVGALQELDWAQKSVPDDIRQSPGYFETRQSKMDYAHFRQEGYPIGSGTVESAINTVVHYRMKRQGRGWKRENGQAMLAALGELHSQRFEYTWKTILSSPN